MKGNLHVRFSEEGKGAISSSYSAIKRIYTDMIDPFFVFDQRGENRAQLINYLKATDKEVGLLLNFGKTPEFKRVIFTNDRKERFESETPNQCVSVESVSSVFPLV